LLDRIYCNLVFRSLLDETLGPYGPGKKADWLFPNPKGGQGSKAWAFKTLWKKEF